MLLILLGVAAGALTTVAGLGGGLLVLLLLSAVEGPKAALAISAAALLVGNTHRLFMLRDKLDAGTALRVVCGAFPGAILGGLTAAWLSDRALSLLIASVVGLALVRPLLKDAPIVPRWALAPAGLGIGVLTGNAGGSGLLVAPLLLSAGLSGARYIATSAAVAVAMHSGRLGAYVSEGMMNPERALDAAILAVGLPLGNLLGERLSHHLSDRRSAQINYGAMALCGALALFGIA
ncbi:sulfite exporter TauE/SafE family protein [Myxococcota bacterium]|nr:sulfite exporter TauE/SafE family protein [Myxococcota bacterium]